MGASELAGLAYQWGVPGLLVLAFVTGIMMNQIFFPRDIKSWSDRLDDARRQLDRADARADAATELARTSADKVSELTELVRMLVVRRDP